MSKKYIALFALVVLLTLPVAALAAQTPAQWFQGIIDRLLDIVILPLFAGVVIIMLLYAGFLFLTAQGDPTKIATARKAVIWAIVGIGVGLLSYAMVGFVKKIIQPYEPPQQCIDNSECNADEYCSADGECELNLPSGN